MSLVNYCNNNFKDPFQAFNVTGHSTVKHAFWYEDEGFNMSSCVFLMFIALYFTQYSTKWYMCDQRYSRQRCSSEM